MIRTGEHHGFSDDEATDSANQYAFHVNPVPTRDWAAFALQKAQDAYFSAYPEARKHASTLLWDIQKMDSEAAR